MMFVVFISQSIFQYSVSSPAGSKIQPSSSHPTVSTSLPNQTQCLRTTGTGRVMVTTCLKYIIVNIWIITYILVLANGQGKVCFRNVFYFLQFIYSVLARVESFGREAVKSSLTAALCLAGPDKGCSEIYRRTKQEAEIGQYIWHLYLEHDKGLGI